MKGSSEEIFKQLLGMEISPDFKNRVAKATGWNNATVEAALYEYRCFLLLCAQTDLPMTPPEAVDVIWHEHILYTRHYQEVLPQILGKMLHHDPGAKGDAEKYRQQYKRTWRAYRKTFGHEPSALIWPRPQAKITDIFRTRDREVSTDNLSTLWLLAAADSPAYASENSGKNANGSGHSSYHEDSSSYDSSDTSSSGGSSCGSSCGGCGS